MDGLRTLAFLAAPKRYGIALFTGHSLHAFRRKHLPPSTVVKCLLNSANSFQIEIGCDVYTGEEYPEASL
jgi:hypothetical protein